MLEQRDLSDQQKQVVAFYSQVRHIDTINKRRSAFLKLSLAVFVIAFGLVVSIGVYTLPPRESCSSSNICIGSSELSLPYALAISIASAIVLFSLIFAFIQRNRLFKRKRNIVQEIRSVGTVQQSTSAIASTSFLNEHDLRTNLVTAWIHEDLTFRSTLENLLLGNSSTRLVRRQDSDVINQLNQRLLALEKEIADIQKQKGGWGEKFPIWTGVTNNLVSIILSIPTLGALLFSVFSLLRH